MTKAQLEQKVEALEATVAFHKNRAEDARNYNSSRFEELHSKIENREMFLWLGGFLSAAFILAALFAAGSASTAADAYADRCERVVNASAVANQGISPAVTYLCEIPLPERK